MSALWSSCDLGILGFPGTRAQLGSILEGTIRVFIAGCQCCGVVESMRVGRSRRFEECEPTFVIEYTSSNKGYAMRVDCVQVEHG